MSLCRAAHASMTSSCSFSAVFRLASGTSSASPLRTFSSYGRLRVSSKRELQTSTSFRPHTLPSFPSGTPLPHLGGDAVPATMPEVFETRPPPMMEQMRREQQLTQKPTQEKPVIAAAEHTPSPVKTEPKKTSTSTPESSATLQSTTTTEPPKTRPKRKLRARKAAMVLTPTAITQLKTLLDDPEPKMIRVGVKNRGCSGLAYHLEYVEKAGMFDEVVEQEGVKVLIDSKALFSIIGSEMDWQEDALSQRFVFRNPNIKEECGCGESFMV